MMQCGLGQIPPPTCMCSKVVQNTMTMERKHYTLLCSYNIEIYSLKAFSTFRPTLVFKSCT